MRQLILKMTMTLDGFVGGPNGEVDWLFRHRDPAGMKLAVERINDASLHIMGSRTFADMINWWPYADDVLAAPMNSIPKAVFTRKGSASIAKAAPTQAIKDAGAARDTEGGKPRQADAAALKSWNEAYVAAGPLKEEVEKLKQSDGKPIIAHGGAGFARNLIAAGVVDEFYLAVFPVALGRGLPIFSDLLQPLALRLVETKTSPAGVVAMVYRPA